MQDRNGQIDLEGWERVILDALDLGYGLQRNGAGFWVLVRYALRIPCGYSPVPAEVVESLEAKGLIAVQGNKAWPT